jgi:glycosyltransferase involved in cell wall biosynthesis
MDILLLNNYYYARGGAERVFLDEMELLRLHGHTVAGFSRKHPRDIPSEYSGYFPENIQTDSTAFSWSAVKTAREIVYSAAARRSLKDLLDRFRPQIAHAHNIYGRLTTSVLDQLREYRVPVVLSVHDYKLMCPNYKFMHNNHICEECKGGRYYRALRKRCHKNSFAATSIYVLETYLNSLLGKYRNNVACLITPSLFLKSKLVEFGWPEGKIEHVPNFFDAATFEPDCTPGEYFLYFGRLSDEKGIHTLMRTFMRLRGGKQKLLIVGEGPLRRQLEAEATADPRISFAGYLAGTALQDVIRKSRVVIVPSEGYENMPMAVLESMACGKPVIGSRIGGIPEMIRDGIDGALFTHGNSDELLEKMKLIDSLSAMAVRQMGQAAREKAVGEYNADRHYQKLMTIYEKTLQLS